MLNASRNISYEDFIHNSHLKRAFVRSLEIIGEASKKLPKEVKQKYKHIPWKQISGMRDKLAHDYFGVDYEVIWQTVIKDIAEIYELLKEDEN
ncbi:Uncharacterized conserved protein, contains HEPN domain [Desulfurella multipotens]|uniref:Uncharacterized conserved protein, contains HEPN domain n=1 Tax=Desulfurella multipotens TaxID=79269 RepID=A0A1G6RXU3_9BACT|nr:HepT-like ribonuclease domain-containing protein [Desulfurella multipotens]SDD09409.1 Uncharacterized conserved protein, contains HEPN domain [Desulfurella multipotens]